MSRITETKIPCCFASGSSSVTVFWAEGEGHLTIESKEFSVQTGACLDREKVKLMRDQLNMWLGDGKPETAALEAVDAGGEKCE